jgi:hypothetical protein
MADNQDAHSLIVEYAGRREAMIRDGRVSSVLVFTLKMDRNAVGSSQAVNSANSETALNCSGLDSPTC